MTLRAAVEDAMREEILDRNVAKLVRVPTPPRIEREPLGVEEVRAFLKSTRDERLHAMFVVFALLGLRRSEVLGLRWDDVDLEGGHLSIRRGLQRIDGKLLVLPPKTARSRRTVPLPAVVTAKLREHRDRQEAERAALGDKWPNQGYVFTTSIGTAVDPDNCSKLVRAALKQAGVRNVRLHDFRHGCVSVLLGLGVPPRTAMDIVGHSTIEMTMNVYGHVSLDDKRDALDKLGTLFEEA
jgi:integrase